MWLYLRRIGSIQDHVGSKDSLTISLLAENKRQSRWVINASQVCRCRQSWCITESGSGHCGCAIRWWDRICGPDLRLSSSCVLRFNMKQNMIQQTDVLGSHEIGLRHLKLYERIRQTMSGISVLSLTKLRKIRLNTPGIAHCTMGCPMPLVHQDSSLCSIVLLITSKVS